MKQLQRVYVRPFLAPRVNEVLVLTILTTLYRMYYSNMHDMHHLTHHMFGYITLIINMINSFTC